MSKGGSLVRMGFAYSLDDDSLHLSRDLVIDKDMRVDEASVIGGDLTIGESFSVGGKLSGGGLGEFYMTGVLHDLTVEGSRCTFVMPYNCAITRVYAIPQGTTDGGPATLQCRTVLSEIITTHDITIEAAVPAVYTHAVAFSPDLTYVAANGYFEVRVDNTQSNAVKCVVTITGIRS